MELSTYFRINTAGSGQFERTLIVAEEGSYVSYLEGRGGIYNFVTKRGKCVGRNSKISWTQVETGSAITWKYPSVILQGDGSVGEFYSVALVNYYQQADTRTQLTHPSAHTPNPLILQV